MASFIQPIHVGIAARRTRDIAPAITMLALIGGFEHVNVHYRPITEEYRTYARFGDVVMAALGSAQAAQQEFAAELGFGIRREWLSLLSEDRKTRHCFEIIVCVSAVSTGPVALHVPTDTLPDDLFNPLNQEAKKIIVQWAAGVSDVSDEIHRLECGIHNALDRALHVEKTSETVRMN